MAVEYTDCISAEEYDPTHSECLGYDIKQSDGEAPILELWGMLSTPSLPLHPGLLWLEALAPDRVLSIRQIELFDISTVSKSMTC